MSKTRFPALFAAFVATATLCAALGFALLSGPQTIARAAAPPAPTAPNFASDVAPILYQNCAACHRAGQIAPFPLLSLSDAQPRAKLIAAVTQTRVMPPWKAEPGYGDFHGARRLSDTQIATLQAWADAGAPAGDMAKLPAPPQFSDGWQLGKPDLVVKMPRAFTVPADGPDVQQCFVVPLSLTQARYVSAVEFRPSNPKVVHHALFYLDGSGVARHKEAASGVVGYPSFGGPGFLPTGVLGAWVPGTVPLRLPDGVARPLPAGSDLVIQTHFHPIGTAETEQSEVGIYFTRTPPRKIVEGILQASFDLHIPPGAKNYIARDSFLVPVNVHALSIQPHAHLLCKDMKVTATLPNGTVKPLIWIKDWDWNWQGAYPYDHPVALPKGTRLDMAFTYDNSADNPHNPNSPPRAVHFGEQTSDEMALCGLEVTADNEAQRTTLRQAMVWHLIGKYLSRRNAAALSRLP